MAGARAVEEVLARGGADLFDIVMFGDEPYGNYNRIMLSNVLSGMQDTDEIFINPLDWYADNDITLHAGARVTQIDRAARVVTAEPACSERYDVLLIATGSRAFIPPMATCATRPASCSPACSASARIDDCNGMMARAGTSQTAVVIGGGLLGLEAARGLMTHGCDVHVVHLGQHLMDAQLDATGGAILRTAMEEMGVTIHTGATTADPRRDRASPGCASRTAPCSPATWWWSPPASGPTRRSAARRTDGRARHRGGQPHALRRRHERLSWSASARSTAARSTGWWRRCGSRPRSSPTTSPHATRGAPTTAPSWRRS